MSLWPVAQDRHPMHMSQIAIGCSRGLSQLCTLLAPIVCPYLATCPAPDPDVYLLQGICGPRAGMNVCEHLKMERGPGLRTHFGSKETRPPASDYSPSSPDGINSFLEMRLSAKCCMTKPILASTSKSQVPTAYFWSRKHHQTST